MRDILHTHTVEMIVRVSITADDKQEAKEKAEVLVRHHEGDPPEVPPNDDVRIMKYLDVSEV